MQNIQFIQTKNGELSCILNGIHLHSSYNPSREAETFVSNLNPDFNPLVVIVTEPALSYCIKPLKKRFPNAKLGAIRFTKDFHNYNKDWDFIVHIDEIPSLLTKLGEDLLLSTFFISWTPSNKAFSKEYEYTWIEIKKILKTAQDILATRAYFSNRWIKNALRFCVYTKKNYTLKAGNIPILIAASGPSLKESLPYIKKFRTNFYLIALSSAYEVLVHNNIVPDICISTDGGYWAKRHIKNCSIPLILSAESAVPWEKLNTLPVIPLKYGDAPESAILNACGFKSLPGKRNGTVSGTAVEIALNLTSKEIYICGLDLASCQGFQHTQPNALEEDKISVDFKFKNKESRIYPSQQENGSLKIYRDWFSVQEGDFANRLKRLTANNYSYKSDLGNIKTVIWEELILNTEKEKLTLPELVKHNLPSSKERIDIIKKILKDLEKNCISSEWITALLPADFITLNRSTNKEEALKSIQDKISEKINVLMSFVNKLEKSL